MVGLLNFTSNGTLNAQEAERTAQAAAQARQSTPYILSLASPLRWRKFLSICFSMGSFASRADSQQERTCDASDRM